MDMKDMANQYLVALEKQIEIEKANMIQNAAVLKQHSDYIAELENKLAEGRNQLKEENNEEKA